MGDYLSSTFQLANNIDASATSNWTGGFNPVGNSATKFTGTFNGSYFNISSLYIDLPATNDVGLFGYTNGATIENAGLLGNNIAGQNEVGSLVGYNSSTSITNSYATGGVSGSGNDVGALVGYNGNTSSIATGYATANVSGSNNVGGLVGNNNSSSIANTYATGTVSGSGDLGGLVGNNNSSSITNSYATGNVSGSGSNVGGLVGNNVTTSIIINSYATGSASASADAGGLIGNDDSSNTLTNNWWYDALSNGIGNYGPNTSAGHWQKASGASDFFNTSQSVYTGAGPGILPISGWELLPILYSKLILISGPVPAIGLILPTGVKISFRLQQPTFCLMPPV